MSLPPPPFKNPEKITILEILTLEVLKLIGIEQSHWIQLDKEGYELPRRVGK